MTSVTTTPAVALLPAGGEVWEDFLDTIGVSLERFCDEGPGGWMLGYIDALAAAGVRTVLVLFSARVAAPRRCRPTASGATIVVLPAPRAYRRLRRSRGPIGSGASELGKLLSADALRDVARHLGTPLLRLARELRREGVRAILCQEYEYFRFDAAVGLGRLMGLPVFATFQGRDYEHGPVSRMLRPLTMRACAGLLVAPGTEIGRIHARYRLPRDQVTRVFNPVDIRMWGGADRAAARRALGLPPHARVVVWHGRIAIESKGLDVLLDAWTRVCAARAGRDLRLMLMGHGEDAEDFRRRLDTPALASVCWRNEYVTDRRAIRDFLAAGDVFAFPSRYEGFAVAPIEAMACGLPVVAADASGVPDIFEDGAASGGITVPRGDASAFAEALGRVLDDARLSTELGARARRRVEHAFSLEAVGRQLREVLLASGAGAHHAASAPRVAAPSAGR